MPAPQHQNEQVHQYDVLIVSGSPATYSKEHLQRLAKISKIVIAVDRGAEYCRAINTIPNLWVGDGDTTSLETKLWLKDKKVQMIKAPVKKDAVDIALALNEVEARFESASVAIVCATGAKIAHELGFLGTLKDHYKLDIDIYMPDTIMYVLQGYGRRSVMFTPKKDTPFSVIPLTEGAVVSEKGSEWELSEEQLPALAYKGVSNEAKKDKPVSIQCHRGTVLLIIEQEQ